MSRKRGFTSELSLKDEGKRAEKKIKIEFIDLTETSDKENEAELVINTGQRVFEENTPPINNVQVIKTYTTYPEPIADVSLQRTVDSVDTIKADNYFKEKDWWKQHDIPEKERCHRTNCTFEPGPHRTHASPVLTYSLIEKKILIKYLVKENKIYCATSRSVYKAMRREGYLSHRSVEGLRTFFRNSLIYEIGKYVLDPEHSAQFENLRNLREERIVEYKKQKLQQKKRL